MSNYYLFPFERIKKDSKIAIYGAGKAGQDYYNQIKTSNFCEVLFIADKNYVSISRTDLPIVSVEEMISRQDEFDNLVISVTNEIVVMDIIQTLLLQGIKKEKIISSLNRRIYSGFNTSIGTNKLLSSINCIHKEFESFILKAESDINYFSPVITELKNNNDSKEAVLIRLKELVPQMSEKEKIVMLRLFYEGECFDSELLKLFIDTISGLTDNTDLVYWMTIDLTIMIFLYPQYLYNNYYIDRRKLFRKICMEYQFKNTIIPKQKYDIKKVCILGFALLGKGSSPTSLIIQYANELAKMDYEVTIIPLDAYLKCTSDLLLKPFCINSQPSESYKSYHKSALDSKIKVIYSSGSTIKERLQNHLNAVSKFDPDLILDMSDEFNVLSYTYYQNYPVIYIPMRGYASSLFFSYYAAKDRYECIKANKEYNSINKSQIVELPIVLMPPKQNNIYTRKQFNLGNDKFILVTVGVRLQYEISELFIDILCDCLLTHEDIIWILVGTKSFDYIEKKFQSLIEKRQVIFWGYENDLQALYDICDVYINPERMGGGASIFWAMLKSIPIATTQFYSDIMPTLGTENSIKGDYNDLINYVIKLKTDKLFFSFKRKSIQNRANDMVAKSQAAIKNILKLKENYYGKNSK